MTNYLKKPTNKYFEYTCRGIPEISLQKINDTISNNKIIFKSSTMAQDLVNKKIVIFSVRMLSHQHLGDNNTSITTYTKFYKDE